MSDSDHNADLFRSVVQNANDLITVFDLHGRIVFINDASLPVLGAPPAAIIGRNILEFVHPDESERAVLTLKLSREYGAAGGNVHFRMRHADGSFVSLEFTSGTARGGDDPLMMTSGRRADARFALEQTLEDLLGDGSLAEIMTNVCDMFSWRQVDSRVAVAWKDPDGAVDWVNVGILPDILCGVNAAAGSPWAVARETMTAARGDDLSQLSDDLRELATATGLGGYWVEPVSFGAQPALITIWTAAGGRPPSIHSHGMDVARHIVELILRWTDQRWRLDFAANHDELTRLPNRKAFFRALEGSAHGAVLYCDLDRFKPVNDTYGHAAGDQVLKEVAVRLRACMRESDLVARIGGDEFAVVCPGSTPDDATAMAERIRAAVVRPIAIDGDVVEVGISIGVAHTTAHLDAASLAEADRKLYEMKASRRTTSS